MGEGRYLTARRAAEELGVSLATLYAYVSRGMIRSEAGGGSRSEKSGGGIPTGWWRVPSTGVRRSWSPLSRS